MTERLTNLVSVKDWLEITTDDGDASLIRLIDAASQFTLNYLNRDSFQGASYTQNFKGNGKDSMLIRNWPILSVASVGISGKLISASTLGTGGLPGSGYVVSDRRQAPQSIDLYGYCFDRGMPCQVIYRAGYETTQTTAIPVDPYKITPNAGGVWSADLGVTINGVAAILVTGTPTAGHYAVDEWGTYLFALADVGKTAVMSYSYTPFDLSFAVTEMIGEWAKRKDRIGLISKSLGGQETVTFSQKDFNASIKGTLQNYKNEVPM